jgi:uncharacterized protein
MTSHSPILSLTPNRPAISVSQQQDPSLQPLSRLQILMLMGVTAVVFLIISKLWLRFGSVSLLSVSWDAGSILTGIGLGLIITSASFVV